VNQKPNVERTGAGQNLDLDAKLKGGKIQGLGERGKRMGMPGKKRGFVSGGDHRCKLTSYRRASLKGGRKSKGTEGPPFVCSGREKKSDEVRLERPQRLHDAEFTHNHREGMKRKAKRRGRIPGTKFFSNPYFHRKRGEESR